MVVSAGDIGMLIGVVAKLMGVDVYMFWSYENACVVRMGEAY